MSRKTAGVGGLGFPASDEWPALTVIPLNRRGELRWGSQQSNRLLHRVVFGLC